MPHTALWPRTGAQPIRRNGCSRLARNVRPVESVHGGRRGAPLTPLPIRTIRGCAALWSTVSLSRCGVRLYLSWRLFLHEGDIEQVGLEDDVLVALHDEVTEMHLNGLVHQDAVIFVSGRCG